MKKNVKEYDVPRRYVCSLIIHVLVWLNWFDMKVKLSCASVRLWKEFMDVLEKEREEGKEEGNGS